MSSCRKPLAKEREALSAFALRCSKARRLVDHDKVPRAYSKERLFNRQHPVRLEIFAIPKITRAVVSASATLQPGRAKNYVVDVHKTFTSTSLTIMCR